MALNLLRLINPRKDANDGVLESNPPRVGNRAGGRAVVLTGTTDVLPTTDSGVIWDDFESITTSTSAVRLTAATVTDHDMAVIDVETAPIRFRVDGVAAPTASVGRTALAGDQIILTDLSELSNFRAIRRDGTDATLRVTYGYRRAT